MAKQDMAFRIGHGFDVHRFKAGDHIILGGVKIPYSRAFDAHSDGDVLIHAVCDALLGAIARGDIGRHFPDTDDAYKDIDSRILLGKVYSLVLELGYKVGNLDVTVIAQKPKLSTYISDIQQSLSNLLETDNEQINIKATTTEKLGYIGREEGIAVHSVVLLFKT
jgi:2-C-methyl-D-erythritol 2,4-cyclodiphosphate synthase